MTSHIPSHPKARAVEAGGALGRGPECEPENLSVDAGAGGDAAQILLFWPRGLRVRPSRSDLRALRRNFWGVARVRSTGVNKYFASFRALDLSLLVTWNFLHSRNEFRTTMAHAGSSSSPLKLCSPPPPYVPALVRIHGFCPPTPRPALERPLSAVHSLRKGGNISTSRSTTFTSRHLKVKVTYTITRSTPTSGGHTYVGDEWCKIAPLPSLPPICPPP